MSEKLDLEARLFHPVFAEYAPSIADLAAEEWGQLYMQEQLIPSLRVHLAHARHRGTLLAALASFLPLWRAMSRILARFGPIWTEEQMGAALSHVEPLVEAWVAQVAPSHPTRPPCLPTAQPPDRPAFRRPDPRPDPPAFRPSPWPCSPRFLPSLPGRGVHVHAAGADATR